MAEIKNTHQAKSIKMKALNENHNYFLLYLGYFKYKWAQGQRSKRSQFR